MVNCEYFFDCLNKALAFKQKLESNRNPQDAKVLVDIVKVNNHAYVMFASFIPVPGSEFEPHMGAE
jgi:hypothetical protein